MQECTVAFRALMLTTTTRTTHDILDAKLTIVYLNPDINQANTRLNPLCCRHSHRISPNRHAPFGTTISNRAPVPGSPVSVNESSNIIYFSAITCKSRSVPGESVRGRSKTPRVIPSGEHHPFCKLSNPFKRTENTHQDGEERARDTTGFQ